MDTPLVSARYYGDAGGSTNYWYWVVGKYSWGVGPMSAGAPVTVLSLSHSNVVSINWNALPSVTGVDVLRTTTSAAPAGTSSVAIVTNYSTQDGFVDNGLPTFSYTVLTAGPQSAQDYEKQQKDVEEQAKKNAEEEQKALKEWRERKEKKEKIDLEQAEQARQANEFYDSAVGFKAETPAQKFARENAEREYEEQEKNRKSGGVGAYKTATVPPEPPPAQPPHAGPPVNPETKPSDHDKQHDKHHDHKQDEKLTRPS